MNLLFMANQGLPRNGLVALYDPYRDTYGRNILPAGSENFVTKWTLENSTYITTGIPLTPNGYASSGVLLKEKTASSGHDMYCRATNTIGSATFSILIQNLFQNIFIIF